MILVIGGFICLSMIIIKVSYKKYLNQERICIPLVFARQRGCSDALLVSHNVFDRIP